MQGIVNPAYAVERIRILAEDIREVAGWLRENYPNEYESRERLGMLEKALASPEFEERLKTSLRPPSASRESAASTPAPSP